MPSTAHPYRSPGLSSARLVPPPTRARRVAWTLAAAFGVFIVFALSSPWQQSVRGTGRVIAYAPLERRQALEAPVTGRVAEWFVQEGSVVNEGDPVVRLSDNDPLLMARLEAERSAIAERLRSYEDRAAAQAARIDAVSRAQDGSIESHRADRRAAERAVEVADQAEQAATAALRTAELNLTRLTSLYEQGLASARDRELAELAHAQARTDLDARRARARAVRDQLSSAGASVDRARGERDAELEGARASLRSAESDVAAMRAALAQLDVRILASGGPGRHRAPRRHHLPARRESGR